jgi:hypothetical protein
MLHEVLIRTSTGRRLFTIDDDFVNSLSIAKENREPCALFVSTWLTLLADSPLDPNNKPYRLYRRFLNRIQQEGIKAIVVRFTSLAHELVSRQSIMGSSSQMGDWIDGFKDTPVFFEYNRYFQTGDPSILAYLYSFLNFGKKLEYKDPSFYEVAFRDWLGIEKRLNDQVISDALLDQLKSVVTELLPRFKWRDLRPKFGPGAVAERGVRGRICKLRSFKYDSLIDRFLLRGHLGNYGFGEDSGASVDKVIPDPSNWRPAKGESSRTSELRFVDKNLKVARSICMEPNTLMYFQQAVASRIYELIDDSPLRHFINVRDQNRNKELALAGSIFGEIDTLDLSAASDSVSIDLVKRVFPASWLIPMLVTRSSKVNTPGGLIHLRKFAPMGSALCFPTQCIIFASICILAACHFTYGIEYPDGDEPSPVWVKDNVRRIIRTFSNVPLDYATTLLQPLAIYGDDICVDGRLTGIVKLILSQLGFVVNEEKSFVGSQSFRESCGGFYLAGHDITPVYFRVKQVRRGLPTSSHVASQVHLINECWERKFLRTYQFLHKSIVEWGSRGMRKNPIPYTLDPDRFGIRCRQPVNSHLAVREHPDYQRTEYRAWTITYTHTDKPGSLLPVVDAYEYMRWWANRTSDIATEKFSVLRYDTGRPGLRWKWMPAE